MSPCRTWAKTLAIFKHSAFQRTTLPHDSHVFPNPLPKDKILHLFNLKAFADDNSNVVKMMNYVLDGEENIVRKGENTGYQHFLLFPQCFQKRSCPTSLKLGIMW